MNKIYLYSTTDGPVEFLFFNSSGVLVDTVAGVQNPNLVWEASVPDLPADDYTVIGKSGNRTHGKEDIRWDGSNVVPPETVIAKAVRSELTPELIHLVSLQNGIDCRSVDYAP